MKGGSFNSLVECLWVELQRMAEELKRDIDFWSSMAKYSDVSGSAHQVDQAMVDLSLENLGQVEAASHRVSPLRGQLPHWHSPDLWGSLLEILVAEASEFGQRIAGMVRRYRQDSLQSGQGSATNATDVTEWEADIEKITALVGYLKAAQALAMEFGEERHRRKDKRAQ